VQNIALFLALNAHLGGQNGSFNTQHFKISAQKRKSSIEIPPEHFNLVPRDKIFTASGGRMRLRFTRLRRAHKLPTLAGFNPMFDSF
jgi:hypothetical protein